MRAREFILESRIGSLQDDVADALPATFVLPELKNQDAYLQYRFGVALAAVKGSKERAADGIPPFDTSSAWGENQIVVSYDPNIDQLIDDALKLMGKHKKIMISSPTSIETPNVNVRSPVSNWNVKK